jgi:hypothetical protein
MLHEWRHATSVSRGDQLNERRERGGVMMIEA